MFALVVRIQLGAGPSCDEGSKKKIRMSMPGKTAQIKKGRNMAGYRPPVRRTEARDEPFPFPQRFEAADRTYSWLVGRRGLPSGSSLRKAGGEAAGDFLQLLSPGAYVGGIDLQNCFLRWLVAPSRRRYLGVRHPATGVLGVYLFLPFRLGPPPGWGDTCVRAVLGAVRVNIPRLRLVDFVGDIRCAYSSGEHGELAPGMAGFMSLVDRMSARYHTEDGKWWWPTRAMPWSGFVVDTQSGVVRMEERKIENGVRLREALFGAQPGSTVPARGLLASVSFLNFLDLVVPGGFCHLRSGWDSVNESGATDRRIAGAKRVFAQAAASEELRYDMLGRRKMLPPRPGKKLQFSEPGGFV